MVRVTVPLSPLGFATLPYYFAPFSFARMTEIYSFVPVVAPVYFSVMVSPGLPLAVVSVTAKLRLLSFSVSFQSLPL